MVYTIQTAKLHDRSVNSITDINRTTSFMVYTIQTAKLHDRSVNSITDINRTTSLKPIELVTTHRSSL